MQKIIGGIVLLAVPVMVVGILSAQSGKSSNGQDLMQTERPDWAYGIPLEGTPNVPRPTKPEDDGTILSLPGTDVTYTRDELGAGARSFGAILYRSSDTFSPPDWYPNDHPQPVPDIVAHGRPPEVGDRVLACALCHYPNGQGRPENGSVAGLPVEYFMKQMSDFASGLRNSSEDRKGNSKTMAEIARNTTEEEWLQAAEYYGAQPWRLWTEVVETDTIWQSYTLEGIYLPVDCEIDNFTECDDSTETSPTEPIGLRIVETPADIALGELYRSPRSGWTTYVPVGSVEKGQALAEAGKCSICHGEGLKGLGPLPGIAGRTASYLMRALYDMQQGTRQGAWSDLMVPAIADLSTEELTYLVAYAASLDPR